MKNTLNIFGLNRLTHYFITKPKTSFPTGHNSSSCRSKSLLFFIIFLSLYNCSFGRSVRLVKTGGNNTLTSYGQPNPPYATTPGAVETPIFVASDWINPTFAGTSEMKFEEVSSPLSSRNWTEIFRYISETINSDLEKHDPNVKYEIVIHSPDNTQPMLVGRQYMDFAPDMDTNEHRYAYGWMMLYLEQVGDNATNEAVIIRSSVSGQRSYLKYVDNLKYGSYVLPTATFTYYNFHFSDPANGINNVQFFSTENPDISPHWNCNNCTHTPPTSTTTAPGNVENIRTDIVLPPAARWRHVYGTNGHGNNIKAAPTVFISLLNCNNVIIQDLEVDGNLKKAKIGGINGDAGVQALYTGIGIGHSKITTINNCKMESFGMDGLSLVGNTYDVNVTGCEFNYCGRSGLAWVGGDKASFKLTDFNYSGNIFNNDLGDNFINSPCCGVDLEQEGFPVTNGTFDHCNFLDPKGLCLENSAYPDIVHDMLFKNECKFSKKSGYGVWAIGKNFNYTDCDFVCKIKYASPGFQLGDETKFTHCTFKDDITWPTDATDINIRLIEYDMSRRVTFDDCDFTLSQPGREFLNISMSQVMNVPPYEEFTLLKDCNFYYTNPNQGANTIADRSFFKFVRLEGINLIDASSLPNCEYKQIDFWHTFIEGSPLTSCSPYSLTIKGPVKANIVYSLPFLIGDQMDGTNGRGILNIEDKALLDIDYYYNNNFAANGVKVGISSVINIKQGGSIIGKSNFNILGNYNQLPGSYIGMNSLNTLWSGNGNLFFSNACNTSGAVINPYWTTPCFPFLFSLPSSFSINYPQQQQNLNLYGQSINPNIPVIGNITTPNPNYKNIAVNGPFSVMYNFMDVSCNGGNNGTITSNASGGMNIISYNLQPGNITNTTGSFTTLGAAVYTLTATDANGCTAQTTITIAQPQSALSWQMINLGNLTCAGVSDGTINSSTSGGTAGISYGLQPGNLTSSNGAFTLLAAGNYIITATDANGCSITSAITLNASTNSSGYCCSPTSFAFATASTTTQLNGGSVTSYGLPSIVTGNSYAINGTFTINNNIEFSGCTIQITPGSKINVEAGKTLKLTSCNLSAALECGMWDGIYTLGTNAVVDISGGSISDMYNGIVINTAGKLNSQNGTSYNDNRISIQLIGLPASYNGIIKNSEFKKNNPFAPLYTNTILAPQHGIYIKNCPTITIGGTTQEGNYFKSLYNGIYINQSLANNVQGTITTSYNRFEEFIAGPTITSVTLDPQLAVRGTAIYTINNNVLSDLHLVHYGLDNASLLDFQNVQKGIISINNHTEIKGNRFVEGELGFQLVCDGHLSSVIQNHIQKAYVGITISGASWGGCNDNEISDIKSTLGNVPFPSAFMGKGIEWSAPNAGGMVIRNNNISSKKAENIVGFNFNNVPFANLYENNISFLTNTAGDNTQGNPNLIGISMNRSQRIDAWANNVIDNFQTTSDTRRSCGIMMVHSKENYLHCNTNDNLRTGIEVVGDCRGNRMGSPWQPYAGVEQNRVITTRFGWLLRHLGSDGNFGNIGEQGVYDANNKWQSLDPANNIKVIRTFNNATQCNPTQIPIIFTNSSNIVNSNSESNIGGNACSYFVDNFTPGIPYLCSTPVNQLSQLTPIDGNYAVDIAEDSIIYSEFEEESERFDERWLYAHLVSDSTLRQQYPVLNQFYLSRQGSTLDMLARVDLMISLLSDTSTIKDSTSFTTLLATARTANNSITSTEFYALTEKRMNDYFFNLLEHSVNYLNESDWIDVQSTAEECPFVAGYGVYKARSIFSTLNPMGYYNDLNICNYVGMYKGGGGLFNEENGQLFGSNINNFLVNIIQKENIKLFPNPGNDIIRALYPYAGGKNKILKLFDLHGRIIKEISLPEHCNGFGFSVLDIPSGVYVYKFIVDNTIVNNGKFVKD